VCSSYLACVRTGSAAIDDIDADARVTMTTLLRRINRKSKFLVQRNRLESSLQTPRLRKETRHPTRTTRSRGARRAVDDDSFTDPPPHGLQHKACRIDATRKRTQSNRLDFRKNPTPRWRRDPEFAQNNRKAFSLQKQR
jgi:hypothetical protein